MIGQFLLPWLLFVTMETFHSKHKCVLLLCTALPAPSFSSSTPSPLLFPLPILLPSLPLFLLPSYALSLFPSLPPSFLCPLPLPLSSSFLPMPRLSLSSPAAQISSPGVSQSPWLQVRQETCQAKQQTLTYIQL